MNVLITGGAGFIGSRMALKLIAKGHSVTVVDSLAEQIHGPGGVMSPLYLSIADKVQFVRGDVCSRSTMEQILSKQDAVVHLAAETGTGQSMYEIEKYCAVNIGGTALLLDLLVNKKHSVKKFIVAESRAIYGEGKYNCGSCGVVYPASRSEEAMALGQFEPRCPQCGGDVTLLATDEGSEIQPTSVYGISKQVQGQLVHCVCRTMGIQSVSFRYQNVYGPGQSLKNPYTGILSLFSNRLRQNLPIDIFEDGKESRDFVFIDDVVDGTLACLDRDEASYEAFNIGTGVAIDVLTVAKTLKEFYGSDSEITVSGRFRIGDIRHNYADIGKARRVLGFVPRFSFEAGLERFGAWVKSQPLESDGFGRSIDELKSRGLYR